MKKRQLEWKTNEDSNDYISDFDIRVAEGNYNEISQQCSNGETAIAVLYCLIDFVKEECFWELYWLQKYDFINSQSPKLWLGNLDAKWRHWD